jgi:hypothetical protein
VGPCPAADPRYQIYSVGPRAMAAGEAAASPGVGDAPADRAGWLLELDARYSALPLREHEFDGDPTNAHQARRDHFDRQRHDSPPRRGRVGLVAARPVSNHRRPGGARSATPEARQREAGDPAFPGGLDLGRDASAKTPRLGRSVPGRGASVPRRTPPPAPRWRRGSR